MKTGPLHFSVRLGSICFTIVLNLLFLSKIPWFDNINPVGINYRLIIYLNFISSFLTLFLMPRTLGQFRFLFDKNLFVKVLKFSIPIVMISIVGVSNDIFGRIWLENLTPKGYYGNLANKDLIGIYSGCAKVYKPWHSGLPLCSRSIFLFHSRQKRYGQISLPIFYLVCGSRFAGIGGHRMQHRCYSRYLSEKTWIPDRSTSHFFSPACQFFLRGIL